MTGSRKSSIRLAAVGDLLLTTEPDGSATRGLESISTEIRTLFATCDLVFANLESTLINESRVNTEPVVLATEKQLSSLRGTGINVVSLGNNHAFDCFEAGFNGAVDLLNNLQIKWFGAGLDESQAFRPLIIDKNDISIAFIGAVDISSGPSQFATDSKGGVAVFDTDRICQLIRELKREVNHVVVSPHWGMERFRMPSPEQIEQAHVLVDAGASLILGHHPHVVQGLETYRGAAIAYSLGNFLANKVYWRNGDHLTWNRFERTGCVLVAEISSEKIYDVQMIPVFDDGVQIRRDNSGHGERYFSNANRYLRKGVTGSIHSREKFYVQKVKPIVSQLAWSKIKRIRPGHFNKLLKLLAQ